jgi:hypothetical protein
MTFLPQNERAPEGNYMKFIDGENTFRVLSSAVTGFEYWTKDDQPVRVKTEPVTLPADIQYKDGKPTKPKYFWAFVVWNYRAEKKQILNVTQAGIQNDIRALVENKKWGDPKGYDITVNRSGKGFDTEYQVVPNPHSTLTVDPTVDHINLEALFTGNDPFAPNFKAETPVEDTRKMLVPGDEGYIDPNTPDFLQ